MLLAQEREERGGARAIELARDVVEQEDRTHAARVPPTTSISADLSASDDGAMLPLRGDAAHRVAAEASARSSRCGPTSALPRRRSRGAPARERRAERLRRVGRARA